LGSARQTDERRRKPPYRNLYRVDGLEGRKMLISLMLICAVLASLAFGILAAYGVCLGFFRLMAGRTAPVRASLEATPAKAEL
jgi:hypothetical protein